MRRRTEFQQIAELFVPLTERAPGALALADDAAVLAPPPGQDLVVTKDAIVAGVHFIEDDPPDLIARKLVRVNLSDLAAMGAEPYGMLLACAFTPACDDAWVEAFVRGLEADVKEFGCPVFGGDTVATPGPATFSLTALGLLPHGSALLRSGARPGDLLVVTGTIGDGAFGLLAARGQLDGKLSQDEVEYLVDRYRLPRPRTALAPRLRGLVDACMDISDGLLQDLGHICDRSGVAAEVRLAEVPLSEAVARLAADDPETALKAVGGGDDYELLLAVPAERLDAVCEAARSVGIGVSVIGRFTKGGGIRVLGPDGQVVEASERGFSHF